MQAQFWSTTRTSSLKRSRKRSSLAVLAASLSLAPTIALAQRSPGAEQLQRISRLNELEQIRRDSRLQANEKIPPGQRLLFDYGAYLTLDYVSVDDSVENNHVLREYEFLPYVRLNFDGAQEVFIRGKFGYQDFNDGDSFDGLGDEPIDGDLDRAYYRFDLAGYRAAYQGITSDNRFVFQAGRDFTYWGNGLVLATVLDGVALSFGNEDVNIDLIAGVTPTRTVDIDTSRPNFDHNTKRGFYGAQVSGRFGNHRPYVYGLIQRDYNDDDFRQVSFISTEYEYNSYYIGFGSTGGIGQKIRYGVEAAYEGGDTKSNSFSLDGFGISPVDQTTDTIRAFALNARVDYFVEDPRHTRLGAEFTLATGDSDRGHSANTFNGNFPDTNDGSFNAFGLINTGLAFAPDVSNIMALRVGAATFPFSDVSALRRLQVGADVFGFFKTKQQAPIDEVTGDDFFLGFEPDIYLNWQMTSDITLAIRYGIFFPDEGNFASDKPRQLLYAGVTFAF
jgi:hypothetical protein